MFASRMHKALVTFVAAFAVFAAMGCALPDVAQAAAVVYDGTEKEWHGEDLQEQDVFMSFDGAMPGDVLTHDAQIRVDRPLEPVTLFVKLDCDEATASALADVTCTVSMDGKTVGSATLGELSATPLSIGTYPGATTVDMHVEMALPTSLGNEHQQAIYPVAWRFIAQEQDGSIPGDDSKPGEVPSKPGEVPSKPGQGPSAGGSELLPQTGDNKLLAYGPWLFGALGVGMIALATRNRGEEFSR